MRAENVQVLVVDDEPEVVDLLCTLLTDSGYDTVPAYEGPDALAAISKSSFDVVVTDLNMPGVDGMRVLLHAKAAGYPTEVIVITGHDDVSTAVQCMKAGAFDFVTKPFQLDAVISVVGSAAGKSRAERENRRLRDSIDATKHALMLALEARDSYTFGHCVNVARIARDFCRHLSLGPEVIAAIEAVGELHDVGKVGIADFILSKPNKLTAGEYEIMQSHPVVGRSIIDPMGVFGMQGELVFHHHERWDGRGYPSGLEGETIPLVARVLALADTFDALTSNRPYRNALPFETAVEIIRSGSSTQFQPDLAEPFLTFIHDYINTTDPVDITEVLERARPMYR